jgi:hypothetical protein
MVKKDELKLTVLEAGRQADVGRGLARLPEQVMEKLNVEQGDVIEITGSRSEERRVGKECNSEC